MHYSKYLILAKRQVVSESEFIAKSEKCGKVMFKNAPAPEQIFYMGDGFTYIMSNRHVLLRPLTTLRKINWTHIFIFMSQVIGNKANIQKLSRVLQT